MKGILHKISHWTGWNFGTVGHRKIDGVWYIGFICSGCGQFRSPTRSSIND